MSASITTGKKYIKDYLFSIRDCLNLHKKIYSQTLLIILKIALDRHITINRISLIALKVI